MKKFIFLFFLIIFLISSCGSSKVLILTDPHWEYFINQSDKRYNIYKYWTFYKKGLVPDFETYSGKLQDFPQWFDNLIKVKRYSAIILTVPLRNSLSGNLPESVLNTVVMGSKPLNRSSLVITQNNRALTQAGEILKEKWQDENRTPLAVLWNGSDNFEAEYEALLASWGSDREILEKNIFVFDQNSSDAEGKLNSFYNRYNLGEGMWTLLAAAEPYLSEILKTWPGGENIEGILMSPRQEYLPDNIIYLITKNNRAILNAAASLISSEEKSATESVEALFIYR